MQAILFAISKGHGAMMGDKTTIVFLATPHRLGPGNEGQALVNAMVQAGKLAYDTMAYRQDIRIFSKIIAEIHEEFARQADAYNFISIYSEKDSAENGLVHHSLTLLTSLHRMLKPDTDHPS